LSYYHSFIKRKTKPFYPVILSFFYYKQAQNETLCHNYVPFGAKAGGICRQDDTEDSGLKLYIVIEKIAKMGGTIEVR
jgi:hypothetical protein